MTQSAAGGVVNWLNAFFNVVFYRLGNVVDYDQMRRFL